MIELNQTQIQILKELSNTKQSPTQLSKKINSTISNISQNLKLLEAKGYLTKKRIDQGIGGRKNNKNRIQYQINKKETIIINIGEETKIETIEQNKKNQIIINTLIKKNDTQLLLNYYEDNKQELEQIEELYITKQNKQQTQILIIAKEVEPFRKKHKYEYKNKELIIWSHTPKEYKEGIQKKEEYFEELEKNKSRII